MMEVKRNDGFGLNRAPRNRWPNRKRRLTFVRDDFGYVVMAGESKLGEVRLREMDGGGEHWVSDGELLAAVSGETPEDVFRQLAGC